MSENKTNKKQSNFETTGAFKLYQCRLVRYFRKTA